MNGTGESFLSLDLFSVGFKNILLVLLRGRSPPSPPMDPPLATATYDGLL